MIKDAYCSFEVSKLLKKKGFAEPLVNYYYTTKGKRVGYLIPEVQYLCPTLQMACAWLREKNIFIYVEPFITDNLEGYKPWLRTFNSNWFNPLCKQGTSYTSTYEEAIESALKYALENLI